MKLFFNTKLITPLFILLGVSLQSSVASAVELPDISVTLSPSTTKLSLQPGEKYDGMLSIINSGKSGYDFKVYTAPYSMNIETYDKPDFLTKKPRSDLYSWLTLSKDRFHLDSAKKITIPYTLTVPEKASPGGHYGVVFIEVLPTQNEQEATQPGNRIDRKKRLGTIFYTTVQGEVVRKGSVGASIISWWQYAPPLASERRIKNIGNTDFDITYAMTVKDVFGNKKFQSTKIFPILPDTSRLVRLEWNESVWYGLYHVDTRTEFLGRTYLASQYVLLLPMWLAFIISVLLMGGIYALARRYRRS